ncbi:NUDIX domain-containing protein [Blastomonas aquatica]|uniref:NUDIX hydrolase n=1 Tax=Blastomonas aquatica TaxID=1510276 RepID=A0ABQ1JML2_9SPHN|nr:NUDIX domain-containing protein [Blastomonas aquatica]GGB72122.1 NUDIX hydrolase [Blastomonas aquatica]
MADPVPVSSDPDALTIDPKTGELLPEATPAATIIVFREPRFGGAPELLMVERSAQMVFAGGAVVFPGGRVDPDDHALARSLDHTLEPDEAAARIAAIRETIEETGLGIGFADSPQGDALARARAAMHAGAVFSDLVRECGWRFDLAAMTPFTRWRPPFNNHRVFDTRFYIAQCESHDHIVEVDATENRHLFWATAAQALAMAEEGKVKLIFPTRRNLERLAQFSSISQAREHLAQYPSRMIMPYIEDRGGQQHLCIPDGLGYPVTSEPLSGAMRT